MSTVERVLALSGVSRSRALLSLSLGTLAVGFGVALMATAGYLISRAAEQPPILALTTVIVVVRFLALARPLARYLDRLASHDLALRALGRIRANVYERIEPLAPAELDAFRRGDLVSRLVSDVDALQGLYLRGLLPSFVGLVVSVACVVTVAFVLPVAAVVLAARTRTRRDRGTGARRKAGPPRRPAPGAGAGRADRGARRAPAGRTRARRLRPRGRCPRARPRG